MDAFGGLFASLRDCRAGGFGYFLDGKGAFSLGRGLGNGPRSDDRGPFFLQDP